MIFLATRILKGHIADFPVSGIKLGNNNIETLNSQIFRFQRLDSFRVELFSLSKCPTLHDLS